MPFFAVAKNIVMAGYGATPTCPRTQKNSDYRGDADEKCSPRDFLTVAQGGPRGFRQWTRKQQNSSTGYCLDGARQARAVDLLIDPAHAVIDTSSQSLVES